jgi:hypothetical protein
MKKTLTSFVASALVLGAFPVAQAQIMSYPAPQFVPASGWTVKPSVADPQRELADLKLPCMMMVEYENGFILRLSGGSNQIMAMAVDFRQDVFQKGKKYKGMVSINTGFGGEIDPAAFTPSTLIINARDLNGFYQALKSGSVMTLAVEGNVFQFTLGNVPEALSRLEACYKGDSDTTVGGMAQPVGAMPMGEPSVPVPLMPARVPMSDQMPRGPQDPVMTPDAPAPAPVLSAPVAPPMPALERTTLSQVTPASAMVSPPPAPRTPSAPADTMLSRPMKAPNWNTKPAAMAPVPGATPAAANAVVMPESQPRRVRPTNPSNNMWRAQAGDSIHATLARWSEQADVNLDWQADMSGTVAQDVNYTGDFSSAVQTLLAENAAATGLQANLMGGSYGSVPVPGAPMNSPTSIIPVSRAPASVPAVEEPMPVDGRWQASSGYNLRRVLDDWSRREGVELYWQANQAFAVKRPVSSNATYENAVESLLEQYMNDDVRPVAQLNRDPESGRRILLVQSTRI